MKARRRGARALILAAFLLALAYEGFSYKRQTHRAEAGPAESEANRRDAVAFPWVGAGMIVIAAAPLLLTPKGLTAHPTARDQSEGPDGMPDDEDGRRLRSQDRGNETQDVSGRRASRGTRRA